MSQRKRRPFDSDSDSDHEGYRPRLLNSYTKKTSAPTASDPPLPPAPLPPHHDEQQVVTSITVLGEELHVEDFAEFDESAYAAHRQDVVKEFQRDKDELEDLLKQQAAQRAQRQLMWHRYWMETYGGQDSNVDLADVEEQLRGVRAAVLEVKTKLADIHRAHTTTQLRHDRDEDELVTEINRLRSRLL